MVYRNLPSDEVLRLGSKLDIVGEVKGCAPVDNLSVGVRCLFGAERWPSDLAFKHNGSQTPPVTVVRVTMPTENFRSNIIGCTDGGVCHNTSRSTPVVNDSSVADRQIDLVEINRVAVARLWRRLTLQKLLVVGVVMEAMEASRQAEIGELNMSAPIK